MKKIILLLILISQFCKAQMILENTYPNSSQASSGFKKFLLIPFATNDFKYFLFEPAISQFKLYNINHSLYATVNVPVTYNSSTNNYNICFVTRSLFDCDTSNFEYAIMNLGDGSPTFASPYFAVYRSTGVLLQKVDTCRFQNYGQGMVYGPMWNHVPIINTQAGAKLILCHLNGSIKIYALCSMLPTNISTNQFDNDPNLLPFPNPSSSSITLPYKFSTNEKNGTILIYDLKGTIIKKFEVDDTFESIVLNSNDLPFGTYIYTLKTKTSESKSNKFTISK